MTEHEDTYSRNAQAWHYTNAQINELIQEAEQALEFRDRQSVRWSPCQMPEDSTIPPGPAERIVLSEGGLDQSVRGPQGPSSRTPKKGQKRGDQRTTPKSPLSPDRESQNEERKSAIDAVKQITGAHKETPVMGGISVGDTPEYDWDTRYDGIRGFPNHSKNRVSEPSTLQRSQSPGRGSITPRQPQRTYKQLKVYDETPAGRPLPTLQQIRQVNLCKIFEEEGADTPCNICKDPHHEYRNCTKEAYLESQDVRQDLEGEKEPRSQWPNCDRPNPGICSCVW